MNALAHHAGTAAAPGAAPKEAPSTISADAPVGGKDASGKSTPPPPAVPTADVSQNPPASDQQHD